MIRKYLILSLLITTSLFTRCIKADSKEHETSVEKSEPEEKSEISEILETAAGHHYYNYGRFRGRGFYPYGRYRYRYYRPRPSLHLPGRIYHHHHHIPLGPHLPFGHLPYHGPHGFHHGRGHHFG